MSPKFYPLQQSPLFLLRRERKLAELVEKTPGEVRRLAKQENRYSEWDIKKSSGKLRHIENPVRPLKIVQAKLARLMGRINPPTYLFCPVKGRSYVHNASQHAGNRAIRCLDIKEYFSNTSRNRVVWFFKTVMKCEPDIAHRLADIACFNGHLPTGSPLSPIMAFYAHYDVWENVAKIAGKHGLTFTLYIDDLTISGHHVHEGVMWEIKQVLARAKLKYHKEKSYFDCPAEVTGVIITPDGHMVLPKRQHLKLKEARDELRAASFQAAEIDFSDLLSRISGLEGQWAQLNQVRQSLNQRLSSNM